MVILWLVIAVIAGLAEVTTTGLFMATIAVAALLTAAMSLVTGVLFAQVAVFGALSLAGVFVIRPKVISLLGIQYSTDDGRALTSHMINRRAVVTLQVDDAGGQVRIGQAEFWSARSAEPGTVLSPGTAVDVLWVDGVNAMVQRADNVEPSTSQTEPTTEIHTSTGV